MKIINRLRKALMNENNYRFPENLRAKNASIEVQAAYVLREAAEAYCEAQGGGNDILTAHECWDVIHSVEGVLRKLDQKIVEQEYLAVIKKCTDRGDYESE